MPSAYREGAPPQQSIYCFYCGGIVDHLCGSCGADSQRAPGSAPGPCRRCEKGTLARLPFGAWGCAACHGVFLDASDWDAAVDAIRNGGSLEIAAQVPLPPGQPAYDPAQPAPCPSCGTKMDRARFGVRSAMTIDVCARHGLWLDGGELAGVIEFVRRLWQNGGAIPLTPEQARDEAALREFQRFWAEYDEKKRQLEEEIRTATRGT